MDALGRGAAVARGALGIAGGGQALEGLREAEGVNPARAGALVAHIAGHTAYDGEARPLREGQGAVLVLQEHGPLERGAQGESVVRLDVEGVGPGGVLMRAAGEGRDAGGALVYITLVKLPPPDGAQGLALHIRAAAGHGEVAAGAEGGEPVGQRAPVGYDEAAEAPLAAEYVREQAAVVAAIDAVEPVVRAHDRAGAAALHGALEGGEVYLAERALVHDAVGAEARELLRIRGEVLGAGRGALGLHAAYECGGELAGEERVLAVVLEVPPAEGAALYVDAGAQYAADAAAERLAGYGAADFGGQGRIPGARDGDLAGEAGGRARGRDAEHAEAAAPVALIPQAVRARRT